MPHKLKPLFQPQSIAVIGASDRYGSTGRAVFTHLLVQGVAPVIVPVNPSHKMVGGLKSHENILDVVAETPIDLAIVILSADKMSAIVREIAKAKISFMIFINDLEQPSPSVRQKLNRAAEQARKLGIRFLALPVNGFFDFFEKNSFSSCSYVGQSSGIADCIKSYANERGISFCRFLTLNPHTHTISTGNIVDFVVSESPQNALLIHISVLDNARELLSAITAAARHQPVVVLTTLSDENEERLFNQSLERNRILTVQTLTQFFTAAKLIHTGIISRGKRVAMISNTPQIAALALKSLAQTELSLANLTAQTHRAIGKMLAHKPDDFNPLYLPAESSPSVFQAAVSQVLQDENTDAVFLIYAGLNTPENQRVAQMVAKLQQKKSKPLLLVWLGSADTSEIRHIFNQHQNLHFRQPEHALHALSQLNYYRQHQQNRHRIGAFHNYASAAEMAAALRKHLRPLLPRAVLPVSKNTVAHFVATLGLENAVSQKDVPPVQLQVSWGIEADFGQVLHLHTAQKHTALLPPLTPEIVSKALNDLALPVIVWQDFLLNLCDVFTRLPEIHHAQLGLFYDVQRSGLGCSEAKLNLAEPNYDAFSGSLNVFTPYPHEKERVLDLPNGTQATLRPIRPEDAELLQRFVAEQSEESRYNRFMIRNNTLSPSLLAKLSRPDYQREFGLILCDAEHNPLAFANYSADSDGTSCEFGISLADKLQGCGMGTVLLRELIEHAKQQGFAQIRAEILANNHPMQKLALKLGFVLAQNPHDNSMVDARLSLQ